MASSVDLGAKLESAVDRLVKTGRFNSRSEVIREGVRLIDERETKLAALDAMIEEGMADVRAGRVRPLADVAAELDARYAEMSDRKRA